MLKGGVTKRRRDNGRPN